MTDQLNNVSVYIKRDTNQSNLIVNTTGSKVLRSVVGTVHRLDKLVPLETNTTQSSVLAMQK